MKTSAILVAIGATFVSGAEVLPARPEHQLVYIVTRSATAESHALLSSRLVRLKAENLHWYEDANVLRAELPKDALTQVRADPDVVLALPDQFPPEASATATPGPMPPAATPMPSAPMPSAPMPPMPMPSMPPPPTIPPMAPPMGAPAGMGMSSGIGMGMGMGMQPLSLVDSVAGMVLTHLLNPPPACRISVARQVAIVPAAGSEEVIEVKASGSCAWQAQASVPWIKIASGSGASGSGIVSYTIPPGEGKKRTGSISIVGTAGGSPIKGSATVVVTQTAM